MVPPFARPGRDTTTPAPHLSAAASRRPGPSTNKKRASSRATVRKVIRGHKTEFKYERGVQPTPKLGDWVNVPPDTTAAIFWLKNRDPAHWRDAWQLEHVTGKYVISDQPMTEEQWIRERATVVDGEAVDITPETSPALPSSGAGSQKRGKSE